jgi:adenosylcobinamide kinase/adenosylcobinamide-phosphate guanylyltransferase
VTARAETTTLVTGPVRSGKSRHAEALLAGRSGVTYVATGPVGTGDADWSRRVEAHRARRPSTWGTVETSDLVGVLGAARGPLLVDCLGTWLTRLVDAHGWDDLVSAAAAVDIERRRLVAALCAAAVSVVVVSNEVGWSLVAPTASGRFFQDELGRLNAAVAEVAGRVHLVVAGRVLDLSDAPTVGSEVAGGGAPTARTPRG